MAKYDFRNWRLNKSAFRVCSPDMCAPVKPVVMPCDIGNDVMAYINCLCPLTRKSMQLSPREIDHLRLHQVGVLAQKRLARGCRLNHPEAVALIATQVLEFIRDGRRVAELMELGQQFLGRRQVMPGVPEMIHDVQVEGTFPDGTKLVTVHHPIMQENGDLSLALYGSFFPVPDLKLFADKSEEQPSVLSPH